MKKIFTLLVMVALTTCWVSCSDDDDKDEEAPKVKKLISKIEFQTTDNYYNTTWEYTYNNDQSIKTINQTSIEDGERYTQINTLEHSVDKLIIHVTNSSPEENGKQYTITCSLNAQKNVSDIKADIDCASNNSRFVYSDDNHLIKNTIEYDEEIEWDNNGNLLNISGYSDIRCTISEFENKTNIDLNQILLDYPNTDGDFDVTALTGYIGAKSKNLIQSGSDWTSVDSYKYVVDEEGYPTEIRGMSSSDKTYCVYKITYIK